ncbi:MAG: replication restart helicase PriA [Cyclonatronaceae bacterium]
MCAISPESSLPLFADVALPVAVREVFTYEVEEELRAALMPGQRVWVPFHGRIALGMLVRLHNDPPAFATKPLRKILDSRPVMSADMLRLCQWMHRFYVCGLGEVLQAALPNGLNFTTVQMLRPVPPAENSILSLPKTEQQIYDEVSARASYSLAEAQQRWNGAKKHINALKRRKLLEIWEEPTMNEPEKTELVWVWAGREAAQEYFKTRQKQDKKLLKWEQAGLHLFAHNLLPAPTAGLLGRDAITAYTLKKLEEEGFLTKESRPVQAAEPDYDVNPEAISGLNEEQHAALQDILEAMRSGTYQKFLLYGITGSGKTEVYIHALKAALEAGKGALVLVPEIALTPQTVRRFYRIFGPRIAMLHSRMSQRERYDAWQALREGRKDIVIGPRSAIFAPIANPGIIIMDEEHDSSYYQADPAPRYHAREVAAVRAYFSGAALVLGSATPSLVSLTETTRKKSRLLKLRERHSGAVLPEVKVLNLIEYKGAMRGPLAVPLYRAIIEAVGRGEQVILLYNRRGFSRFMQCESCGEVVECPHCSVSLTYHKRGEQLRCHYCGYSTPVPYFCPDCESHEIKMQGSGTQQIEEELEELFPEFRLLRMDQDTTSRKNAHDKILGAFGRGEADIMIGTQLVAKGLDFPNVTVVGVVNADTELAFPSYRSNERMFQLLSQVAGRSGRAEKKGVVFLQTRQSDHFAIKHAQTHDYEGYARHELSLRKPLLYPPYARLLSVSFKSKDASLGLRAAERFTEVMRKSGLDYPVLGPAPDAIEKIKDEYRFLSLMKLPASIKTNRLERLCAHFLAYYEKYKPEGSSKVKATLSHEML